jgi:transposase-like protein
MLVQRRRDSRAALRLMRKLLKKQGFAPKLLVTDKLRSYASAGFNNEPPRRGRHAWMAVKL